MDENTLSVQELSNKIGKSIQSIYKRINNKNDMIQGFLKRDEQGNIIEPVRIYEKVIDVVYNKGDIKPKPTAKPSLVEVSEKETQQEQNAYTKAIEVLQDQINLLKEELEVEREEKKQKDVLISQLNDRLAESQRNLDQQQQLQLLDKQRIRQLEEKNTRPLHQRLLDVFRKKEVEQ